MSRLSAQPRTVRPHTLATDYFQKRLGEEVAMFQQTSPARRVGMGVQNFNFFAINLKKTEDFQLKNLYVKNNIFGREENFRQAKI